LEEEPKNVADVSIAATIGPVFANRATRADSSVPGPRSDFADRSSRTDINAAPRRKVVANFDASADDFAAVRHPTEDQPPPRPRGGGPPAPDESTRDTGTVIRFRQPGASSGPPVSEDGTTSGNAYRISKRLATERERYSPDALPLHDLSALH
jgi:hypothetical protein